MKKTVLLLVLIFFGFFFTQTVRADYVLPYPSYMPGNRLYKVMRVIDTMKRYWYFGNIAQTKYHLELSDKYLVEAKTLLEYNQFLLASDALAGSDKEFMQIDVYLNMAKTGGVDISALRGTVLSAADKHISILKALKLNTPVKFTWKPEKALPTELNLGSMLQSSIDLRVRVATATAAL